MDVNYEQSVRKEISRSDTDSDEVVQDWSEMARIAKKSRQAVIPRRGEKDYEPDGTNVQLSQLNQAKNSFFKTLSDSIRGTTIKNSIKAYWEEKLRMGRIPNPRGSFMNTIGKVDRFGQCWLHLHEYLYLVERGTLTPYMEFISAEGIKCDLILSVQDVYSFFQSDEELDEFFIYAYLKRLGYIVTATYNKPVEITSIFPPFPNKFNFKEYLLSYTKLIKSFNVSIYNPLNFILNKYTNSQQIYDSLSGLVPYFVCPKTLQQVVDEHRNKTLEPSIKQWKISFNVWKPQTNFKKKNPGLPDFQVVIYNKNDKFTKFPTYPEFRSIFQRLDYKLEFLKEVDVDDSTAWDDFSYTNGKLRSEHMAGQKKTSLQYNSGKNDKRAKKSKRTYPEYIQKIRQLKDGHRAFILAIMDDGLISFVRISESDFGSRNIYYPPSSKSSTKIKKREKPDCNKISEINK